MTGDAGKDVADPIFACEPRPAVTFGEHLRELRGRFDLTLGDLARLFGVSVVTVSEIERDKRPLKQASR
jgi:DNA-binding transcriptional regulator YiaG